MLISYKEFWGGCLKEEMLPVHDKICRYVSGSFKATQLKYPSVEKEILAVMNCIKAFQFFIQSESFILRSDLNNFKSHLDRFGNSNAP